jgi:hypothetical protein
MAEMQRTRSEAEGKINRWIHVVRIGSKELMKMWIQGYLPKIHDMDNYWRRNKERWIHA